MIPFSEVKKQAFKNPEFCKAYKLVEVEYALIDKMIEQRIKDGVTQAELAQKMGTTQSAVSRFERGDSNPTWKFLQKLADALGVKLKVTLSN